MVFPEAYAKRAVELGQGILSSCEHGWQGPPYVYWKAAKDNGLKYLMSAEAYWVRDRLEKDGTNCHIWIGAKNEIGRLALNDAISEANISGFYKQARLDIPLILSLPKDDVWVTSACIAGWKYEDADDIMKRFGDHFGENFFLEVQYHNTEAQAKLNEHILKLRYETGMNIIMGCDSHYILQSQDQDRTDFLSSKGMHYEDEEGWYLDFARQSGVPEVGLAGGFAGTGDSGAAGVFQRPARFGESPEKSTYKNNHPARRFFPCF